jgi:hypothetical protein
MSDLGQLTYEIACKSPVCKVLWLNVIPGNHKPYVKLDTERRTTNVYGIDGSNPDAKSTIEDLLKQVETGYFKEVLVHSNLFMNFGYRIICLKSKECETPYSRANTKDRTIKLFNVDDENPEDWQTISEMLLGADSSYPHG